jgi:hypothetical protein
MPGLVPGIHVFLFRFQDVDGRDEPGHDDQFRKLRLGPRPRYFAGALASTGSEAWTRSCRWRLAA